MFNGVFVFGTPSQGNNVGTSPSFNAEWPRPDYSHAINCAFFGSSSEELNLWEIGGLTFLSLTNPPILPLGPCCCQTLSSFGLWRDSAPTGFVSRGMLALPATCQELRILVSLTSPHRSNAAGASLSNLDLNRGNESNYIKSSKRILIFSISRNSSRCSGLPQYRIPRSVLTPSWL